MVNSPKQAIRKLNILFDGGEQTADAKDWQGWSVAEFEWYGEPCIGVRWNGSSDNPGVTHIGNPHSRGIPTWFVVPKPFEDAVRDVLAQASKWRR
jgi:hypothetical protein